jgi:O-antigen/teichoic acid export membrane protein
MAGARGVSIITALVSVPLTLNYLGQERYGLWMTISSVIAMLGFADLGLGNGLLNLISEANGRDDKSAAKTAVSSAFFMLLGIAAVLGAGFAIAYPFANWGKFFNVQSHQAISEAGPAVAVFVLCFLARIVVGNVDRVQCGYQEGFVNSIWQGVGNAVGLASVLLAIKLQLGLQWLVLAMTGAPIAATLLNGGNLFLRKRPWLLPSVKSVSRGACKRLLRMGILFFILQAIGAIALASDNMIIAQVSGPEAVAQYAVPMRLFGLAAMLVGFIVSPLWPAYGEAIARGDTAWVRRTLYRSLRLAALTTTVGVLGFILAGRTILHYWVGDEIRPTYLLLAGLGVWTIMSTVGTTLAMFMNGANLMGIQALAALGFAIGAPVTKVLLCRSMGISGVAWGGVISYGLLAQLPQLLLIPMMLRRIDAHSADARPNSVAVIRGVSSI